MSSSRKPTPEDFITDENLWNSPKDPEFLDSVIKSHRAKLMSETDPLKRCQLFGELGVYLRSMRKLIEAEAAVAAALKLVQSEKLGVRIETQQRIRFAHILQWQRRFAESSALFDEIILACQEFPEASPLLPFAYQQSGKNEFDQGKYEQALKLFEKALALRLEQSAPEDQIESTKLAIRETKKRLGI